MPRRWPGAVDDFIPGDLFSDKKPSHDEPCNSLPTSPAARPRVSRVGTAVVETFGQSLGGRGVGRPATGARDPRSAHRSHPRSGNDDWLQHERFAYEGGTIRRDRINAEPLKPGRNFRLIDCPNVKLVARIT